MKVRTRIAPSPTGEDIHIGNLYTALLNYAVAKQHDGKFIVRIEDTDRERLVKGSEERILKTLVNYHLDYDEGPDKKGKYGPYKQSERLDLYQEKLSILIEKNAAYYCFCSKERLERLRKEYQEKKKTPKYDKYCLDHVTDAPKRIERGESYVVRLNVPENQEISFHDLIRGEITFNTNDVDDQVLLKSDGYPTYHLAVVVDDHLMEISHVIRAEDWISSTPKHVLLYNAFGWQLPLFAHVPLLRNPDKSKLSKRKNPVWAGWYLSEGYIPEAVLNFLSLMGWSHPEEKEYFSLSEFISLFDIKDVKPVGPIFDITKLTWMNQHYIQNMSDEELKKRILLYTGDSLHLDEGLLDKLLPLLKTRMKTLKDVYSLTSHFTSDIDVSVRNEKEDEVRLELLSGFESLSQWNKDTIFDVCKTVMAKYGIRMNVLYYLLTGEERGLPLPESLEILGKDRVIQRLTRE